MQISTSLPCKQNLERTEEKKKKRKKERGKENADMKKVCDFMVRCYHLSFTVLTQCTYPLFYIQISLSSASFTFAYNTGPNYCTSWFKVKSEKIWKCNRETNKKI